jgi:hypothetical protein
LARSAVIVAGYESAEQAEEYAADALAVARAVLREAKP